MDHFTHDLLPYLVGSILRLNKRDLTVLVLGWIAPDFDVLLVWISYFYPNYLLITHRGFTHTFFFGVFIALAILRLASYEPVKDRESEGSSTLSP
jgi:inner membrane protein